MSDLVGTLEDRLSRVAAHIVLSLTLKYAIYMYREETSRDMQPLLTNRQSTLLIPFNFWKFEGICIGDKTLNQGLCLL